MKTTLPSTLQTFYDQGLRVGILIGATIAGALVAAIALVLRFAD